MKRDFGRIEANLGDTARLLARPVMHKIRAYTANLLTAINLGEDPSTLAHDQTIASSGGMS